jgi:hypothetical protein
VQKIPYLSGIFMHPKNFPVEEKSPVKLHPLGWSGDFSGNFSDFRKRRAGAVFREGLLER